MVWLINPWLNPHKIPPFFYKKKLFIKYSFTSTSFYVSLLVFYVSLLVLVNHFWLPKHSPLHSSKSLILNQQRDLTVPILLFLALSFFLLSIPVSVFLSLQNLNRELKEQSKWRGPLIHHALLLHLLLILPLLHLIRHRIN